jgi:activating signal cointegrator complex subunit 3
VRGDRSLVERFFSQGLVRVLCCTATLAWGVNLPAHTVIIKGTQLYNAEKGGFVELGMLDVMQIFGRAGRPQFDSSGEGIIITAYDQLAHYLRMVTHQLPIESEMIAEMPNHLNAEIILGTVSNMNEAIRWLDYTYLARRMVKNPMHYGIDHAELESDPQLATRKRKLVEQSLRLLDESQMVSFDPKSGNLYTTNVGRTASHYYLHYESVKMYNEKMKSTLKWEEMFEILASSKEFERMKVRDEELTELEKICRSGCLYPIKNMHTTVGKANVLLQSYITGTELRTQTLCSDLYFISASAGRICRALFELSLKRNQATLAFKLLKLCKMFDRRIWYVEHPLRQFKQIKPQFIKKMEDLKKHASVSRLIDMSAQDIGVLIRHNEAGKIIKRCLLQIPYLDVAVTVQPLTNKLLRMQVTITPDFQWNDAVHGSAEAWWIWVCDTESDTLYYQEYFVLHKKEKDHEHNLMFTIPIREPLPSQYILQVVSDRWIGSESDQPVTFKHLLLPEKETVYTKLLDLRPMPKRALYNPAAESMYRWKHMNPMQTQVFHTLYHEDCNVLLGAPTGSGKTFTAEMSMLRLFAMHPDAKVVYIAPLKALARERIKEWRDSDLSFRAVLGKKILELTGDSSPEPRLLREADVLITTPEKWDGVTRDWRERDYVRKVGLVIIDEIHLLGCDRGPILEVIVSRMRYISTQTERQVRIVGLSTALSNAGDLGEWLGIVEGRGLFNFPSSVRPVPLEIHLSGHDGKHFCPRMAKMTKPTYAAITTHSPDKPVLVFVASRRQTRITALDLISYAANDDSAKRWCRMNDMELEKVQSSVRDQHLRHMLAFGIGMHHAGLNADDRNIVEGLFVDLKIQVLVCTSTLAWGVNFPCHLVVVKGTEYFDGKLMRYVDFPITDVLQMVGRAGRPQFDDSGVACVLVHAPKKLFYQQFLYSPFPVESSLKEVLHDHINAEIVGGTITCLQDAVEYLTWTFFYRRLLLNPSYYDLHDVSAEGILSYLTDLLTAVLIDLEDAGCIELDDADVSPLFLGEIASYYYISHKTVAVFADKMARQNGMAQVLDVLCSVAEFSEMPVRHNEDKENEILAKGVHFPFAASTAWDSPHVKTNLLLQAFVGRLPLPSSDYNTDTKSVLDQAGRVLSAMVDVSAEARWLRQTLCIIELRQCLCQARWTAEDALRNLPGVNDALLTRLRNLGVRDVAAAIQRRDAVVKAAKQGGGGGGGVVGKLTAVLDRLPNMQLKCTVAAAVVVAGASCVINARVMRRSAKKNASRKVHAPKWSKPLTEGWFLVVADDVDDHLYAVQRVSSKSDHSRVGVEFTAPDTPGPHTLTVYLKSTEYIGLDKEQRIVIDVREAGPDDVFDDDDDDDAKCQA